MLDSGDLTQPVTFHSAFSTRFFSAVKLLLVWVFLSIVIAAVYWGGGPVWLFPKQSPPPWFHIPGAVILLLLPIVLRWAAGRSEPTRLTLFPDALQTGGRFFGRTCAYENLKVIKLEKPEGTLGKSVKLIVERNGHRATTIWLSRQDAEEAFDALRSMSEHVPAIGLDSTMYAPVNPEFARQGRLVLAADLRRKANKTLVAGVLMCGCAIGFGALLVLGGSAARSRPKAWIAAVVMPLAGAGSLFASSRLRQQALVLEHTQDEENA